MRGLDESGNNMGTAQISGTIHTSALTGAQIASYNTRYPYLTITADHVTSYLNYRTWDGSSLIQSVVCIDGVPQESSPSGPSRTQTAQYTYTFVGWNTEQDAQTNNPNAITNIMADRDVYAAYSRTVRTYTVTWKNSNGTTLETDNNVAYGATPQYNGATPVDPSGQGAPFVTWTPAVSAVTGNITYTASYKPIWTVTFKSQDGSSTLQTKQVVDGNTATYTGTTPTNEYETAFLGWSNSANSNTADAVLTNIKANKTVYAAFEAAVEDVEITDTWDEIIQHIDAGDYKTRYKVGNYKPLDLGSEGIINMQIVAMNADIDANDNTIPLTFLAKNLLATPKKVSEVKTVWPETTIMYPYLNETIYSMIPNNIQSRIITAKKTYYSYYDNRQTFISLDKIWIPSIREMFFGEVSTTIENTGPNYKLIYKDNASRIKNNLSYWLRSRQNIDNFYTVGENGRNMFFAMRGDNNSYGNGGRWILMGFCLG